MHAGQILVELRCVPLPCDIRQARALKLREQILGRYGNFRIPDRIAAGIEKGSTEYVWITKGKAQRDASSPREPADVDSLRIDAIALHCVMRSKQRQGL